MTSIDDDNRRRPPVAPRATSNATPGRLRAMPRDLVVLGDLGLSDDQIAGYLRMEPARVRALRRYYGIDAARARH